MQRDGGQRRGCAAGRYSDKHSTKYTAQFTNIGIVVGVVADGTAATYTSGSLGAGAPTLDDRTVFEYRSRHQDLYGNASGADGWIGRRRARRSESPSGLAARRHGTLVRWSTDNAREPGRAQNSGLPRLPGNLTVSNPANPYASYTPALLYAYLSHAKLDRAPGATYEYSNLGVGLLGDLLAARAGTTYAQVLTQRVLTPLGLTDTAITPTATMNAQLAPGHTIDGEPQGRWTFAALAGAGALLSDGHDMLAYLKANMAAPDGPLGKAMALAQAPRSDIDTGGPPMKIGLVWNVERSGVVWHNGETGGYHALIGFDRANRKASSYSPTSPIRTSTRSPCTCGTRYRFRLTPFPLIVQVAPATISTTPAFTTSPVVCDNGDARRAERLRAGDRTT